MGPTKAAPRPRPRPGRPPGCPGCAPPPCLRRRRRPPPRGKFGLFIILVPPQCAAFSVSSRVSVHAAICTRPKLANCSALGEPNAGSRSLTPQRDGKPRFSGAIENYSRSFSALEPLRGLPAREGVAVWKTTKMLTCCHVRANLKT